MTTSKKAIEKQAELKAKELETKAEAFIKDAQALSKKHGLEFVALMDYRADKGLFPVLRVQETIKESKIIK